MMLTYWVLAEDTEETIAQTPSKEVAEYLVKNYTVPCFIRVVVK